MSVVARLVILGPPEVQSVSLAQSVLADSEAILAVSDAGSPPLSFHWRHNGEPMPEVTGPVLFIAKAGGGGGIDEGQTGCEVRSDGLRGAVEPLAKRC